MKKSILIGAIIGLVIGGLILLHIYTIGCNPIPLAGGENYCDNSFESIIAIGEFLILLPVGIFDLNNIIFNITLSFIYFALLGTLIGWIYSKIKKQ
jgi:hypothetical protein